MERVGPGLDQVEESLERVGTRTGWAGLGTASVDDLFYSQHSCSATFKFGETLRQLVEEFHSGLGRPWNIGTHLTRIGTRLGWAGLGTGWDELGMGWDALGTGWDALGAGLAGLGTGLELIGMRLERVRPTWVGTVGFPQRHIIEKDFHGVA